MRASSFSFLPFLNSGICTRPVIGIEFRFDFTPFSMPSQSKQAHKKSSLDTWTKPFPPFYATCLAYFQRHIYGLSPARFIAPGHITADAEHAKKRPPEGGLF
jgi:hypothetical protein